MVASFEGSRGEENFLLAKLKVRVQTKRGVMRGGKRFFARGVLCVSFAKFDYLKES